MQLTIKELGPIRNSDLKLGDLSVIFGRSNTGKSYILKALYSWLCFLDEANSFELATLMTGDLEIPSLVEGGQFSRPIDFRRGVEMLLERYSRRFTSLNHTKLTIEGKDVNGLLDLIERQSEMLRLEKRIYPSYGPICPGASYTIEIGFVNGSIDVSVTKSGTVMDSEFCMSALANKIRASIISYLRSVVIPRMMKPIGDSVKVPSVRLLNHGRFLALFHKVSLIDPYFRSAFYWIERGKEMIRNGADDEEVRKVFNLNMKLESGELLLDGLTVTLSSSSLLEMAALRLSLSDGRGGLVLIEEPEIQLDVMSQVKMALILYSLARKFRIVITTHSEIIILTLAMLSYYLPCLGDEALTEFKNVFGNTVEFVKPVNVSFYHVMEGTLMERSAGDILNNTEIFSEVNKKLLDLGLNLYEKWEARCQQRS
ncbi:hypothetical protein L3N51_01628 [Metallosphaera sp. J1]|uniref:ATP-binding protein n=1 Tax=Metallosphaera javensis (ex Hofmann et al. 2022) TaxID=99938 RepID=UPI001EE04743|nr:ATP-binding protein [Metallosphaera javensis (ex Hofmann et al. 2022)]MCG3109338.1 hypothetical protein [Metallosphaera javensis (ex Hofmann et al. 2022)]